MSVSGFIEAAAALSNYAKPAHWNADLSLSCAMRQQAFADLKARAEKLAAAADDTEVVGGAVPGDGHAFRLFENPGHGNDWISVRLVGVRANRAAIGPESK